MKRTNGKFGRASAVDGIAGKDNAAMLEAMKTIRYLYEEVSRRDKKILELCDRIERLNQRIEELERDLEQANQDFDGLAKIFEPSYSL